MCCPNFSTGSQIFLDLTEFLTNLRTDAGLPDEPENAFRAGDLYYDVLRKLVHVSRLSAGNPDEPEFEFRAGDTAQDLLRKLLTNLSTGLAELPIYNFRVGDNDTDLFHKILRVVRITFGQPDDEQHGWRPGDTIGEVLRKIVSNTTL